MPEPIVDPVASGLIAKPTKNIYDGYGGSSSSSVGGTPRTPQGNYQSLPSATANGTELPNRPPYINGVMLYMPVGSTFEHFIAPTGTTPAGPANGNKLKYTATGTDLEQPVYLSGTDAVFVTAATNGTATGTPAIQFKYVQR